MDFILLKEHSMNMARKRTDLCLSSKITNHKVLGFFLACIVYKSASLPRNRYSSSTYPSVTFHSQFSTRAGGTLSSQCTVEGTQMKPIIVTPTASIGHRNKTSDRGIGTATSIDKSTCKLRPSTVWSEELCGPLHPRFCFRDSGDR